MSTDRDRLEYLTRRLSVAALAVRALGGLDQGHQAVEEMIDDICVELTAFAEVAR